MGTSYLLDNAGRQTGERFYGLEATFDPVSRRHLDATGVAPGWSCWEIGAGGGSIARWLAERVGPEGSVLATDLNLEWAVAAPNVELRQHDVVRDPIPERAYDLIHARLVLVHLAERAEVIDRLIAALKPGGWLVLEEFDDIVRPCPDERTDDERVFNKVRRAFLDLLRARGADLTYPRRLPHLLRAKGLRAIAAEGHVAFVTGGSAGGSIERANLLQVGHQVIATGLVTSDEVARFLALLDDPAFDHMSRCWSLRAASGRASGLCGMRTGIREPNASSHNAPRPAPLSRRRAFR